MLEKYDGREGPSISSRSWNAARPDAARPDGMKNYLVLNIASSRGDVAHERTA